MFNHDYTYKDYFIFYAQNYGWPPLDKFQLDEYLKVCELEAYWSGLYRISENREAHLIKKRVLAITARRNPADFLAYLIKISRNEYLIKSK